MGTQKSNYSKDYPHNKVPQQNTRKSMKRYLAMDVETGGFGKDKSLLTAYFAVLNEQLEVISELDLKLIPDDGIYVVTPQALEVNKLNLVNLGQEAIPYKEARTIFYRFLGNNYEGEQLVPLGQNVNFDLEFITDVIISKGSLEQFVSRRPVDTMYIAIFLKELGLLPVDQSVSLASLTEYFKVTAEGNLHEAKYDTLITIEVYKALKNLARVG